MRDVLRSAELRPRRSAGWRARLLLVAAGLLLGGLAAEWFLAASGLVSLSPYEQDRVCGTRLKPNYAGWQTREGKVLVRTSSAGFRDREHLLAKPPNTLRIAVLGDSYCEAMQVELHQTFWSIIERTVPDCLPDDAATIEVINSGVAGYGTAQELLTLQHRLWNYDPDVILLCVLPANDIRNNSRTLEPDRNRPFYRLEDDRLVLDTTFLDNPLFASPWVRWKDRLVSRTRLGALAYRWRHRGSDAAVQPLGEAGLDSFIYAPPQDPKQQEAWRITERLIEEIHRQVQERGAMLVIATIASGIQVHPDAATRQALMTRLGLEELDYAEGRIAKLGNALGCLTITLANPMRNYAESRGVYLHGFENTELGTGHWNADGHRVAGEIIAQALCGNPQFRQLAGR